MGGYTLNFGRALLHMLGAPETQSNLDFLNAWGLAEGGKSANNPFNTGESAPGATPFNKDVNNYPDMNTGLEATYRNLQNPLYAQLVATLRRGNSSVASANALAASEWGTGNGALRVLQGDGNQLPAPVVGEPLGTFQGPISGDNPPSGTVSGNAPGNTSGSNPTGIDAVVAFFQNMMTLTFPTTWVRIQAGIAGAVLIVIGIVLFAKEGIGRG